MDNTGREATTYGLPLPAKAHNIFFSTASVQILLLSHRSVSPAERGPFSACEAARSFPSTNEITNAWNFGPHFYKWSCDEASFITVTTPYYYALDIHTYDCRT